MANYPTGYTYILCMTCFFLKQAITKAYQASQIVDGGWLEVFSFLEKE